jgi:hypothetical protein
MRYAASQPWLARVRVDRAHCRQYHQIRTGGRLQRPAERGLPSTDLVTSQLQVQRVHGVRTDTDLTDPANPQEICEGIRHVALAADHDVLGGSGGDMVETVARQAIRGRNRHGGGVRSTRMARWATDRGQPGPIRVDQQMMLVQDCDELSDPAGVNACGRGCGIQGPGIHAPVKTLRHGDLGLGEPVQDDSGVRAQAQLQ